MIFISCTLPLAVCAARISFLRQAQIAGKVNDSHLLDISVRCALMQAGIAGKVNDSHLLDTPARRVRSRGFSLEASPDCMETSMMFISWTLPFAVCAAMTSPLMQAQIARKIKDFHILDTPARCLCCQGFSFEADPHCKES